MNPILTILEQELLHYPKSKHLQYVGASNISGEYYNNKKLAEIWAMAPYSDNYFSVLNPLFSKVYLELIEKGQQYPLVLLRDGALDLFDFICQYPDPSVFDQKFIIHHKLSSVLPEAWLKNVMLFDYFHRPKKIFRLELPRRRLIVSTIVNNAYIESSQAKDFFISLNKFAIKNDLEIFLHLPIRENLYFDNIYKNQNAAFDLSLMAFDIFGTDTKIISDKTLKSTSDFRDSFYALIPSNQLCISDNYIEHYLLTNGAAPWASFREIKGAYEVSLSNQHGVILFDAVDEHFKTSLFSKIKQDISDLSKSETFHYFQELRSLT